MRDDFLFLTLTIITILGLICGACYAFADTDAELNKCLAGGQSEDTCRFYVYQ